MKKVLLVSSVVFCTISAMAQVPGLKQSPVSIIGLTPVHGGDAFSIRFTAMPKLQTSNLLKNGIRTVGVAAAAYQTEKLVQGNGTKPSDGIVKDNWLAPVGVATTLSAGKLANLFAKSPRQSIKYSFYDKDTNIVL